MGLIYDKSYAQEAQEEIVDYLENRDNYLEYSIEFPDSLSDPPLREIARIFDEGGSFEVRERIAKYCILKQLVKVKLGGEYVDAGFCMNTMNDSWDNFPTLKNHPMAFTLLLDVCVGHVIKKFMPSMRNTTHQREKE